MNRDKNPKFKALFASVAGIGLAVIAFAAYQTANSQSFGSWILLAAFAGVIGSFSLRIPGLNGRVSAGDTITCLSTLLLGPAAGALTAAVDALGGSLRCKSSSRRFQFALYNSCNSAISAFTVGHLAFAVLGQPVVQQQAASSPASLLLPLCVLAAGYFLVNTFLVAAAVATEKSLGLFATWRDGFMWTCVNYFAGAFVAGTIAQVPDPLAPARLAVVLFCCLAVHITSRAYVRLAQKLSQSLESSPSVPHPGSVAA